MPKLRSALFIVLFLAGIQGCGVRVEPAEVRLLLQQQEELRGAGALHYVPVEYQLYQEAEARARALLERERQRLAWFRNYQPVAEAYRLVLDQGRELALKIGKTRQRQAALIAGRHQELTVRLVLLRELSELLKDRRLALPGLVRMEIGLEKSARQVESGRGEEAVASLGQIAEELDEVVAGIRPVLARYAGREEIGQWRRQIAAMLEESRRSGRSLLVVSKAERQLTWYRGGRQMRTYDAGLGFRFLSAKLHSGDQATPEGVYRVVRKLPYSKFFKALLIDYPNGEDRRRYKAARQRGEIPEGAGIGGQIEIHGGGREGMTEGCVALDNQELAELYGQIEVDTPVIIVGTTDYDNPIAMALARLR
ncbi:MAG: L,D-transpeptidase [Proteobacteria bacterium]|nr:L,D-transpeptidase [Pseudomonadota bacterium]